MGFHALGPISANRSALDSSRTGNAPSDNPRAPYTGAGRAGTATGATRARRVLEVAGLAVKGSGEGSLSGNRGVYRVPMGPNRPESWRPGRRRAGQSGEQRGLAGVSTHLRADIAPLQRMDRPSSPLVVSGRFERMLCVFLTALRSARRRIWAKARQYVQYQHRYPVRRWRPAVTGGEGWA